MVFSPGSWRATSATLIVAASTLAGCAAYGDARPTQVLAHAEAEARSLPAQHGEWPDADWVDGFDDPQLAALAREAVLGSPTLQIAIARVDAARAMAEAARSGLYPSMDVQGGITRQRISETDVLRGTPLAGKWLNQVHLAAVLSYDVDFWGKHRAALQAALSAQREAEAESQSARLLLTTGLARVYARIATLYALRDVTEQGIAQRRALAVLAQVRVRAGLDTQSDSATQNANLENAEADLTRIDDAIDVTRHQIAALLGQGPDRALRITRPTLLSSPAAIGNAALPDDARIGLLSRRPDLVAARWGVEAASKDIEVAKAEFLPDINLSMLAGFATITPSDFLLGASRTFAFGPSVRLPVFEGGRLRANLHARYARYDMAVALYNQTLVDALRETASTVSSLRAVDLETARQERALAQAARAWQLASSRRRSGLESEWAVLVAEDAVLRQRAVTVQSQGQRLDLRFALVRALGGGYAGQPPGDEASVADSTASKAGTP